MKRTTWMVAIALIVALVGGYWYWSTREPGMAVDLVEAFRGAEKRSNLPATAAFSMDPQTIKGVTRRALYMHPVSRVIYKVRIPTGARFRGWLGVREEAWDKNTDGVLFRIGISSEGTYSEILTRQVDPCHQPADRDWVPVDLDLGPWAGKEVELIFNTNYSPARMADDSQYDFAVIGSPAIFVAERS